MKSTGHLTIHILISSILYYQYKTPLIFLIIFTLWGAILIDIDHLLIFLFKYKKYTIKEWKEIGDKLYNKHQSDFYIFHSPEINLLLLISSFLHPIFLWLFLGSITHILIDGTMLFHHHRNFNFLKNWSIMSKLKKYLEHAEK